MVASCARAEVTTLLEGAEEVESTEVMGEGVPEAVVGVCAGIPTRSN